MGERNLIRHFRAAPPTHPWVKVGPGHDCAILRWAPGRALAYKIDQVVEGVHFLLAGPEAATPRQVGWKAMAKACSDIAAVGFWPVAAVVAVNLRRALDDSWAKALYGGLAACCERFGFALAGGDFSSGGSTVTVSVSLVGEGPVGKRGVGGPWLRSGARRGDALLVTGTLGGSRAAKHLDFLPRLEEARRIRELGGTAVHAAMDITDGLARDLGHLCDESRCGAEIAESALPVSQELLRTKVGDQRPALEHVLADGEDFELLLAVAPKAAQRLLAAWDHPTTGLSRIGRILPVAEGRRLVKPDGTTQPLPDIGYEHRTASDGQTP